MPIDVGTLPPRSTADLRTFARAQHLVAIRHPDSVAPAQPADEDYWRYLLRRQALEGVCVHYQTYDASGDENDWNLNIAPDPAYEWLIDPGILQALSMFSGAPTVMDPCEVKCYEGILAIECELSPDDDLHDTFTSAGLPITSGGDKVEQEGLGPTGSRVGVYGAFVGDYGHGGRPEVHPFDAFWRRFHEARSTEISWDLGVFQDDSNRFNNDWSDPPIDVELRVPFCLDVPVTMTKPVTTRASFVLERSAFCTVVAKAAEPRPGEGNLVETFVASTVRLAPRRKNRLVVSVEDHTGAPGTPFALRFADLRYTTARQLGLGLQRAWLSGLIVIRVAVGQDGFAYWNLSGPNSRSAADAQTAGGPIAQSPGEVIAKLLAARPDRPPPVRVTVTEARPRIPESKGERLAAEVVIEQRRPGQEEPIRRPINVRPRIEEVFVDEVSGEAIEVDSFGLFATTSIPPVELSEARIVTDISRPMARLFAAEGIGQPLALPPATIEVDDLVSVDVAARYAPYHNGEVQGEERSLLSEAMNRAVTGPVELRADLRITDANGRTRRSRVERLAGSRLEGPPDVRVESLARGYRVVVGPLAGPAAVRVEATLVDEFGLEAVARASLLNFRVVDARRWVETATGSSLTQLRAQHSELERLGRRSPTEKALAAAAMSGALVAVLEGLDGPTAVPASRVAGAVRLANRVRQLLPRPPIKRG